jgi:hypothetical protein
VAVVAADAAAAVALLSSMHASDGDKNKSPPPGYCKLTAGARSLACGAVHWWHFARRRPIADISRESPPAANPHPHCRRRRHPPSTATAAASMVAETATAGFFKSQWLRSLSPALYLRNLSGLLKHCYGHRWCAGSFILVPRSPSNDS